MVSKFKVRHFWSPFVFETKILQIFFYIFPPKNSIRIMNVMNALFFCLKLVNHGAKLHLECIINLFSNMCNLLEFNECFCLDRPDVHTLKMVPLLLESHRFFTNIDRKSVESYACQSYCQGSEHLKVTKQRVPRSKIPKMFHLSRKFKNS